MTDADLQRCEAIAFLRSRGVAEIVREVSNATGIRGADIYGPSRLRPIAHARQLVYYIARRRGMTLQQIARAMNRDHTTVLHGIRAEEARRAQ